MTGRQSILRSVCFGVALLTLAVPARADDFYKGKTISVVVGSAAGGGYDTYARFLAQSWGQFIPGHPGFVVRNMPGAGSLKSANYLYNVAAKDGTEIGAVQKGVLFEPLLRVMGSGNEARFDPMKFNWIGAVVHDQEIMAVWHTAPFKSLADLKGATILSGASGASTSFAVYPRLMNATMGTRIQVINGYKSGSAIRLALQRGEVQAMTGWDYSALASSKADWLRDKQVRILVQFGPRKIPELPDVPLARDHVSNPIDRDVLDLITLPQDLGHPFIAPPGLSKDRVATLQTSFWSMMKDSAFAASAKKHRIELSPSNAEECAEVVKKGYAAPPEVVAKAREILVSKTKGKKTSKKKKM